MCPNVPPAFYCARFCNNINFTLFVFYSDKSEDIFLNLARSRDLFVYLRVWEGFFFPSLFVICPVAFCVSGAEGCACGPGSFTKG